MCLPFSSEIISRDEQSFTVVYINRGKFTSYLEMDLSMFYSIFPKIFYGLVIFVEHQVRLKLLQPSAKLGRKSRSFFFFCVLGFNALHQALI